MDKKEYPRPQFKRSNWINLNGVWQFAFDDKKIGIKEKWYNNSKKYDKFITVPFAYQSENSGLNDRTSHSTVWYYREFELEKKRNKRIILHFGAVDYQSEVFVDGQKVGMHTGGHTSFEFDITDYLSKKNQHCLSIMVEDPIYDESIPRGKQFWGNKSFGIWYTNSTGIWQTVWLEEVSDIHIKNIKITPLFDDGKVQLEPEISEVKSNLFLKFEIIFKGEMVVSSTSMVTEKNILIDFDLFQNYIFRSNYHDEGWSWTPETPNLFNLNLTLYDNKEDIDFVQSYFGMRKVHQEDGMIYLNNKPYYQKLVLDQGYWPKGLLTAPNDEDFVNDIKLSKKMGFNGCRKHQKTEDPRFLYWADKLGYIVWGECASTIAYTDNAIKRLMNEWGEIVRRDYNHPSIITWVPLNESWGVPKISFDRKQQHFSQTMYHYLHSLDDTRLVISNDGWAMTETDICAIHNYGHGNTYEIEKYQYFKDTLSTRESLIKNKSTSWPIFAKPFQYNNQPIMLTEFGGIGFDVSGQPGWGYTSVKNVDDYLNDYKRILDAVYASKAIWGYCYTQLTDVEQEINGLLTYDRKEKCDLSAIRKINDKYHIPQVE